MQVVWKVRVVIACHGECSRTIHAAEPFDYAQGDTVSEGWVSSFCNTFGYHSFSSSCTRVFSVSSVSPGNTEHFFCTIMGPVSTPSSTQWIVMPDSFSHVSRTSSCGWRPGWRGRSAGCTLRMRPRHVRTNHGDKSHIQPMQAISTARTSG